MSPEEFLKIYSQTFKTMTETGSGWEETHKRIMEVLKWYMENCNCKCCKGYKWYKGYKKKESSK